MFRGVYLQLLLVSLQIRLRPSSQSQRLRLKALEDPKRKSESWSENPGLDSDPGWDLEE